MRKTVRIYDHLSEEERKKWYTRGQVATGFNQHFADDDTLIVNRLP